MRALILALLLLPASGAAFAQPYDPATAAAIAAQDQAAAAADAARQAAQIQREIEVERQRLETEQRVQSYEAEQSRRRAAVEALSTPQTAPPASSARIAPRGDALQLGKPAAKREAMH